MKKKKRKIIRLVKVIIGFLIVAPLSRIYWLLVNGDAWEYVTTRSWNYTVTGTVCGVVYMIAVYYFLWQLFYTIYEWYNDEWEE